MYWPIFKVYRNQTPYEYLQERNGKQGNIGNLEAGFKNTLYIINEALSMHEAYVLVYF